jgi:hypothetical protein
MLVSLQEYAELHGKKPDNVRQKIHRGGFETAVKSGGTWMIDSEEPFGRTKQMFPKGAQLAVCRVGAKYGIYEIILTKSAEKMISRDRCIELEYVGDIDTEDLTPDRSIWTLDGETAYETSTKTVKEFIKLNESNKKQYISRMRKIEEIRASHELIETYAYMSPYYIKGGDGLWDLLTENQQGEKFRIKMHVGGFLRHLLICVIVGKDGTETEEADMTEAEQKACDWARRLCPWKTEENARHFKLK